MGNIRLDDDIHYQLKVAAVTKGIRQNQAIKEAILNWLKLNVKK